MLKEITIKNFKSFNDETTFSMEADYKRVREYQDHIVNLNDNKLLKIASIYGPNGGGKSNLLKAIMLLQNLILSKRYPLRLDEYTKCVFSGENDISLTSFFVDDDYEIGFRTTFIVNSNEIPNDNFEYYDNRLYGNSFIPFTILDEEIVFRRKNEKEFQQFLTRDKTGVVNCDMLSTIIGPLAPIAQSKSIVTKIYEDFANNEYSNVEVFDIFKRLYRQIDSIYRLDSSLDDYFYANMYGNQIKRIFKKNSNLKERIISLLKSVDININGISFDKRNMYFERLVNVKGKSILRKIPFSQESKGTQKIFDIFMSLVLNYSRNVIYLFDDMNSYLHPKLCRAIYEWFTSLDNINSQLIFNSHDILNMSKDIFRRDEIWFAYRDENYSTNLIPLSNVVNPYGEQVRNDAVYSKQYLEGKYGADPFIKKGLKWNE